MKDAELLESLSKDVPGLRPLSEMTVNTYVSRLQMLTATTRKSIVESVTNVKRSYTRLQVKYPLSSTRKNVLTAVLAVFSRNPDFKSSHAADYDAWQVRYKNLSLVEKARSQNNRATEEFMKVMIDIQETREIAAAMKSKGLKSKEDSMDHLLLLMMVDMPPKRSDFGALKVTDKMLRSGNFVYVPEVGDIKLVMYEYKTFKTYGRFVETLPKTVATALIDSMAAYPRKYVFEQDNKPMNEHQYGRFVEKTFLRCVKKEAGINTIRHSYITQMVDTKKMTIAEQHALAASMCHSYAMQQKYVMVL